MRSMKKKNVKVKKVMDKFKKGTLHSGSKPGPKVTKRNQAVAIALSEARMIKKIPKHPNARGNADNEILAP